MAWRNSPSANGSKSSAERDRCLTQIVTGNAGNTGSFGRLLSVLPAFFVSRLSQCMVSVLGNMRLEDA